MPFTLSRFAAARPFLYHLTHVGNVERIRRLRRLDCAERLRSLAGASPFSERRREAMPVLIDGEIISIRDQAPLHAGKVAFEGNWKFDDLLQSLNGRVFFWPGKASGPISYGQRHYARYQNDGPAILRVPFEAIVAANPDREPEFCKYNSGSPRVTGGRRSPRGDSTFGKAGTVPYTAGAVVEVTFVDFVKLPEVIEVAQTPTGPWRSL